jgi:phosphoribosyl 1,2-cyclic phosphodiesterase
MTQGDSIIVTAQSFGSGSSGNALLIHAGTTAVLVDCGVGIRSIRSGLAAHGLGLRDLDAILVTHEHSDHVRTLPRVIRPDLPLIATRGTARAARLPEGQVEIIESSTPATVAGATVHALPVRHDATDPCGFHIEIGGARITVLTDLGSWQDHLVDAVAASDLVLLEANYNETMLRHGPYPAHLKRRVASAVGHLGNDACGNAMAPIVRRRGGATTWWLSHLSQTNNTPHQAEREVRETLHRANVDANLAALPRRSDGPVWTFDPATRPSPPPPIRIVAPATSGQLGLPGLD